MWEDAETLINHDCNKMLLLQPLPHVTCCVATTNSKTREAHVTMACPKSLSYSDKGSHTMPLDQRK